MPQHVSAVKRVRQNAVRRQRNREHRSRLRTMVKRILHSEDPSASQSLYPKTQAYIDRLANKGIIHRNKAAHYKSQLSLHLNQAVS
ncbi:MAG: 30S ribosomal protein S20 [Bacteroidetes bacterium]|nr:30S ribosomal protein S20 [Bacteroidota bacterium]MCY4225905.1 30S ribosomal protein S20 [Bacteroidota bacterium]